MAMILPPDFKEFLKFLKEHDVRYLLIGGYARATEDLVIALFESGVVSHRHKK